jgi:phosphoribosylformylglycinamidine (FGAM) synthase PurS component
MIELFVSLKIPDTTAITTFHTIERMGYKVEKVKRELYYKFEVEGNEKKVAEKIGKVDVLVNANKNKYSNKLEREEGAVYVLVKDTEGDNSGLFTTLHKLGLNGIKSVEKGVLWALFMEEEDAKEVADKLLHNENYQDIKVL